MSEKAPQDRNERPHQKGMCSQNPWKLVKQGLLRNLTRPRLLCHQRAEVVSHEAANQVDL
jgi:hypothetical protein